MAIRIFRQASRCRAAFPDERNVFDHRGSPTPQKVIDVDILREEHFHLDALRHPNFSATCPAEQERVVVFVVDTQRQ